MEFVEEDIAVGKPNSIAGYGRCFENLDGERDEIAEFDLPSCDFPVADLVVDVERIPPGQHRTEAVDDPLGKSMEGVTVETRG